MNPRSRSLALAMLVACGGPAAAVAPATPCPSAPSTTPLAATPDAAAPVNDEASRRRLFADLVALVRRYHVFSPQVAKNLGRSWDDELEGMEAQFASAVDRPALTLALIRFGNSLHNQHCGFDSPSDAPLVSIDGSADVEWSDGKPVFYVVDPPKGSALAPGDVIESVNGVAAADFLVREMYRSNANSWFGIAKAVARGLTHRATLTAKVGERVTWMVRPRSGGPAKAIELTWHDAKSSAPGDGSPAPDDESEFAIDYAHRRCSDLPAPNYGPYALVSEGPNFCLYTSKDARYRAYPIVRYFSFAYFRHGEESEEPGFHRARADHDALLSQLSAITGARGVLLDLRDNHGGSNPNYVMDWFAPAPYVDHYVFAKLDDDLRDPKFRHDANMDDPSEAKTFLAQLDARAPGQEFAAKRPFFCPPSGCDWDNRYTPSHRVTTLPLSLLVGPNCVSSCDAFTQQFSEWNFGALVGEPTAAAHTSRRLTREITYLGEKVGELTVAFSYEVSGKSGERVEAVPIHLTERIDRTFANRARYDALLVDRAIADLPTTAPRTKR